MLKRQLVLALLALALALASAGVATRFPAAGRRPYDLPVIPTAAAARLTSLGHPTLVANLWWLRAVQYMGDPLADRRGWDKLHPAADLVTDLDPRHGYAYQVAGILLGAIGEVQESNALFEKGSRALPGRYSLFFQRAVNAFLYETDYAEAARWFEAASRVPGAPAVRMRSYAAAMLVKGANDRDRALAILRESLASAEDEDTRRRIEEQMVQIELEARAGIIEEAVEVYRERHFVDPVSLELLVAAGLLPELPEDPFGGVLHLDADGRVRSSVHPQRFLPRETPDGTPVFGRRSRSSKERQP